MMLVTWCVISLSGGSVRLRKSVICRRSSSAADDPMNSSIEPSREAKASTAGNMLTMAQNDRPAATSLSPRVLLRVGCPSGRLSGRRGPPPLGLVAQA